jgi:DNA-binding MarR family transcriptional regulator
MDLPSDAVELSTPEVRPTVGEGLGDLGDIVGFHLRIAHNAVYRHFMGSFAHLELTQKQTSVLWLIGDNPGIAQISIASRLDMDRATMMAIVDRLEARDFLARTRSKTDRRRQDLHLTAAGEAVLVQARAAVLEHEKWLKARIGDPAEIARFVQTLRRIYL